MQLDHLSARSEEVFRDANANSFFQNNVAAISTLPTQDLSPRPPGLETNTQLFHQLAESQKT